VRCAQNLGALLVQDFENVANVMWMLTVCGASIKLIDQSSSECQHVNEGSLQQCGLWEKAGTHFRQNT